MHLNTVAFALQACRDVLQKVRMEAEARNAGIIFLGEAKS